MKKTLIAFSLIMASMAQAEIITPKQFNQVLEKNAETFMTITEGMTADYSEIIKHNDGLICLTRRKEVVVGVQAPIKYLVYVKQTHLGDCYGSKKGDVQKFLKWNNIVKPDFATDDMGIKSINLEGNLASIKYTYSHLMMSYQATSLIDVTQSQFYADTEFTFDETEITRLLRRSQTDVKTINIDNLEVIE